jgi:hypothetical protein
MQAYISVEVELPGFRQYYVSQLPVVLTEYLRKTIEGGKICRGSSSQRLPSAVVEIHCFGPEARQISWQQEYMQRSLDLLVSRRQRKRMNQRQNNTFQAMSSTRLVQSIWL